MGINFQNAHEKQIRTVNNKKKISPTPEFVLSTGESVMNVQNHDEIIVNATDTDDEEKVKYRVECHAEYVADNRTHPHVPGTKEYIEIKETKDEALKTASERLGTKIPTGDKGIITTVDITRVHKNNV